MIDRHEIKRNLLGVFEICLFMPNAEKRFQNDYDEALRSFYIPIFLFPISLMIIFLEPRLSMIDGSDNTISFLYSMRYAFSIMMFLGIVYFFTSKLGRGEYFLKFITAYNWMSIIPACFALPFVMMLAFGNGDFADMIPYYNVLMIYTYACIAFATMLTLRIPIELGIFIVFISMFVDNGSFQIMEWVGQQI